ncbi:exodeoxyribonuclease VII large subunit [Selenomonas sp. CM52]|uniref:exodeoxyribonuclease VII large subunit n=1 Tax=Selenomonas sp. CM52 TaxID=936381 RepID=UPI00027C68CB|nr:exodeoxyribonuclease VII large subunit [Selenomonas sp. CM52]EJU28131.1 putative exodeoxyribonuclease VII, large subunit [Selenomonas sp. CM52]
MTVHSVSALTQYIKSMFQSEGLLRNVSVEGELSNYKMYASGHCYFTLKDETASLKGVMFKSRARLLRFQPENGMKVVATGEVSVYERDGAYQLYVERLLPVGAGELSVAFEQLKARLAAEGLFNEEHKKPLPPFPRTIGIVTSLSGAVLRDIYRVSKRRDANVRLVLYPTLVQGEGAAAEIAAAIRFFNEKYPVDLLIVGRGGGSAEDLWAFNEEPVVRAIYDSVIPVISAVGHETDTTLSDYASDVRAATPSQAAELAVPETAALIRRIGECEMRLQKAVKSRLYYERERVERLGGFFLKRPPQVLLAERRQRLDMAAEALDHGMRRALLEKQHAFQVAAEKLEMLNPLHVIRRGYSVVEKAGTAVRSVKELAAGDGILVRLADGSFDAVVGGLREGGL